MVTTNQKDALRVVATILIMQILKQRLFKRRPDTNSLLSGAGYLDEIINGNPAHSQEILGMPRQAFLNICYHLRVRGWLKDSRYVSIRKKMAMFLVILSHNTRTRFVKRRFNRSTHTVHRYFHEVLSAMLKFSKEMIVPATYDPNANHIRHHRRLRHIFQGAVGALDGTLIHAVIPLDQQARYRGRGRGECYQNVLAICDFNTVFTFLWAGWEGVAYDSRVLIETMRDSANHFLFPPPDKYYLCDAAYSYTRKFMAPFRNVRYWLSDFAHGNHARTKEERFNHAHARLRNVIERCFGVLKARFPILKRMPPDPFQVKRNIVIACATVHNFLRKTIIADFLFERFDNGDILENTVHHNKNAVDMGAEAR